MKTATATAKAANDAWIDQNCLTPADTISLLELSLHGAGCPPVLEELARLIGIRIETPPARGVPVVHLADLDRLLGPERARLALTYNPYMVPADSLGLPAIFTVGNEAEAVALAARRGVVVDGEMKVDQTAVRALGRILEAERSRRYDWSGQFVHDIVCGNSPLQAMAAIMPTKGPWPTGIPPLPPPPPPREPWEPPPRTLGPADLPTRIVDQDAEVRARCILMGIRTEEGTLDSGNRIRICGYDLWRLLGIPSISRRQQIMYAELQRMAYQTGYPQTGKDT